MFLICSLVLLVLVIVLPFLRLWPPILSGSRARNNTLFAYMDPPSARKYVRPDGERQSHPGVTLQEAGEVALGHLGGALGILALSMPLDRYVYPALVEAQGPSAAIALAITLSILLAIVVAWLRLGIPSLRAAVDLRGSALELRIGATDPQMVDVGFQSYLVAECRRLRRDSQHAHWDQLELERKMRALVQSPVVRLVAWWIGPRARSYSASKRST